jgi:hypothetical protein
LPEGAKREISNGRNVITGCQIEGIVNFRQSVDPDLLITIRDQGITICAIKKARIRSV